MDINGIVTRFRELKEKRDKDTKLTSDVEDRQLISLRRQRQKQLNEVEKKKLKADIKTYTRKKVRRELWGFKDPKFCLIAKHVMHEKFTLERNAEWEAGWVASHQTAHIIWVHRDVDETIMSIIKSLGLNGLDADPNKWRAFVNHYINETQWYIAGHTGPILDINLPDLLAKPRKTVNKISNSIGLRGESGCAPTPAHMEPAYRFIKSSDFISTDP